MAFLLGLTSTGAWCAVNVWLTAFLKCTEAQFNFSPVQPSSLLRSRLVQLYERNSSKSYCGKGSSRLSSSLSPKFFMIKPRFREGKLLTWSHPASRGRGISRAESLPHLGALVCTPPCLSTIPSNIHTQGIGVVCHSQVF